MLILDELDDMLEFEEDELDEAIKSAISEISPFPIYYSCEPGRFQTGKMNVVRWRNRYIPCRRSIPKNLKLGILSRARISLPFNNIRWLLEINQKQETLPEHWINRLPANIDKLFPEVDVTIELFMQRKIPMTSSEVTQTLRHYLINRHKTELINCDKEFFFMAVLSADNGTKTTLEKVLRLGQFGLNLNRLYNRGGVSLKGKKCGSGKLDESIDRFFLLVYVSLPNDLEGYLKPILKAPQRVTDLTKPLPKAAIENLVWAILGEYPSDYKWKKNLEIAKILASFLKTAYKSISNTTGPIGPGFFWDLYQRFQVKNQEKPYLVRGVAMGMAYALMDFALDRQRKTNTLKNNKGIPYGFRPYFYSGYRKMQKRLKRITAKGNNPLATLLYKFRSVKNKQLVMRHIYSALFQVFKLREGLHKYPQENSAFRFCQFKYPTIKACCGNRPNCRLDL